MALSLLLRDLIEHKQFFTRPINGFVMANSSSSRTDVEIFETESYAEEEFQPIDETDPPEIERTRISRKRAAEVFTDDRAMVVGDNFEGRIAQLQREIESLREVKSDQRLTQMADELSKMRINSMAAQSFVVNIGQPQQAAGSTFALDELAKRIPANIVPSDQFLALEQRVATLEQRVGYSNLPSPLYQTIVNMRRQLALLTASPERVEDVSRALNFWLNTVSKSQTPDKVSQLYDRFENLDPLLSELPQLVQRLLSLRTLHEEAAFCQNVVKDLDATLQAVRKEISRWIECLNSFELKSGIVEQSPERKCDTQSDTMSKLL